MAGKYEKWVERSLYECQMFGFTSKAFMDFVYNVISKVAGDAIIELNKQIKEHPELSNVMDEDVREKSFEKVKEMLGKRLDINVDRLELFSRHNTFLIPKNVVLPSDKIQESCQDTKEEEDILDQKRESIIEEIKASYETRIALQKELSTLSELKTMADQVLSNITQTPIPKKEDFSLTCQEVQSFTDILKTLEKNDSQQNLVDA